MKRLDIINEIEDAIIDIENEDYKESKEALKSLIRSLSSNQHHLYDHTFDESLIEGMYGDMLVDKFNVLLKSEGCKSILDALEEKFGV